MKKLADQSNIQPQDKPAAMCAATLLLCTFTLWRVCPTQDMSANEAKGTYLSGEWQEGRGVVTRGPDGKVVFLFGEVQPSVVCSPLQVCEIELQAGEVVRDVLVGDSVRWKVDPATSGAAGGKQST